MFTILLHSSKTMKTMKTAVTNSNSGSLPALLNKSYELSNYLKTLSVEQVQKSMQLSRPMADSVYDLIQNYSRKQVTAPAIDSFLGDIYSGLQVQSFSQEDRAYANEHLYILSGLYGVLRALDEIQPYRVEMGYKFPDKNLYEFWGDKIARQLPKNQTIINLSAVEYTKAVFPYLGSELIITPKFLTISPKTNEPTFVTVHTKIARGAYARWLIQNRIENNEDLTKFHEIGYVFEPSLSTTEQPVFVAKKFQGTGLSVRLT